MDARAAKRGRRICSCSPLSASLKPGILGLGGPLFPHAYLAHACPDIHLVLLGLHLEEV